MRILIPQHFTPDSFVDNVQVTLTAMGHSVRTLGEVPVPRRVLHFRRIATTLKTALFPDRAVGGNRRRLIQIVKDYRPNLILGLTSSLEGELLRELKRICGAPAALWWGDSASNARRRGLVESEWNYVFVKDRSTHAKLSIVHDAAFHLPEAMNPMWHRPIATGRNNRIAVIGNTYAYRQMIVLRLLDRSCEVELHGPPPPRWADHRIAAIHSGRYIVREDKSRVFGASAGALNTMALGEGDSLNCRAFEIAGAGGLQLLEYRQCVEEYFEPGKELLTFKTWDELCELVDRAVAAKGELDHVREAGARRARAEHTYEMRLARLLDVIFGSGQ